MKERELVQKIRDFIQDFDERAARAVKKLVLPATLGLGMAIAPGCGPDDDPGKTRPQTTRPSKADGVDGGVVALYAAPFPGDPNSCEGSCGAQAPGGCYCDDECFAYGDCCEDKAEQCDGNPVLMYAAPFPADGGVPAPTEDGGPVALYAAPFPGDPATCVSDDTSYCGTKAPAGCWCDDQCADYGDCCDDQPSCEMTALYAAPFPDPSE